MKHPGPTQSYVDVKGQGEVDVDVKGQGEVDVNVNLESIVQPETGTFWQLLRVLYLTGGASGFQESEVVESS